MSVINQALKDLDKRQRAAQDVRLRSHYQPGANRVWLWSGALGTGIVLSAVVTWWLVAHALTVSDTSTSGLQSAPEVILLPLSDEEAPGSDEHSHAGAKATVAAPQPQAQIARYSESSQQSAQPEQSDSAQVKERAVTTLEENPAQASTQQQSGPQEHGAREAEQNLLTRLHPIQPASTAGHRSDNGESRDSGSLNAAPADDETEEGRGEMQVQRVERSASELAEQRLEQAVNALESGQGRRAETLLQEALVLQPDYIEARQQLAAYYYGRGFTGEALRVLREGLAHTPSNSRLLTLSARIYEETGRADEALNMLNRVSAQLPEQNDILVLRAALANELGQYRSAAEDYRELLGVSPNQGIWWLGLALAEEGSGDYGAARMAYQRAAEDAALDRASRDYARSRQEALSAW